MLLREILYIREEGEHVLATLGPIMRLLAAVPWIRWMLMVPASPFGAQTISNGSPAVRTWPSVGLEMASKPAVWARAEEAAARTATTENFMMK
jgi:hypothetical protein